MSEREEPLHVDVARSLGWVELCTHDWQGKTQWFGKASPAQDWRVQIPRFDTDWSAAGSLIERYVRDLSISDNRKPAMRWFAGGWDKERDRPFAGFGATPLEAVCHLVIALLAAGKRD